jgi:hypothetical protein
MVFNSESGIRYRYNGEILNNKPNGKGVKIYLDGEYTGNEFEGTFVDGVANGYMIYRLANGERTEGYYDKGKKHGTENYYKLYGEKWVTVFD